MRRYLQKIDLRYIGASELTAGLTNASNVKDLVETLRAAIQKDLDHAEGYIEKYNYDDETDISPLKAELGRIERLLTRLTIREEEN